MFNCWLQLIHPKLLIRWSPHPYMITAWELGKWGFIREDHSLPKVQWFLDHLLGPPVSPGYVGWLEKCLCLAALPLYPSLPRYLLTDDTLNCISCDKSVAEIRGSLSTDLWRLLRYLVDGSGRPEWASTVSLALFLNWVMTWFTVDSGMDRFLYICRWLAPASSWPTILPLWKSVSSKEPGNRGMLIHSVVHYSAICNILITNHWLQVTEWTFIQIQGVYLLLRRLCTFVILV